jgi:voltage-gated potassium channel
MSLPPPRSSRFPQNKFRIKYAVLAVIVAIAVGTLGFYFIEGWSLLSSLYLATQTVTTVGYGDVAPQTSLGRAFATIFMLVGVGVVLYALTSTVQSIVQLELVATFGQRRRYRKMSKLKNHYIVCGAGRVGSRLVRSLLAASETFVVVETNPETVAEMNEMGVMTLARNATLETTLREAGVTQARGLAACLPDDADNVYVVLTARDLNSQLHIVARAAEEQAEAKLIRAGANRVVAPTILGGHRLAVALTKPAVGDFIDSLTVNTLGLAFEQLEVGSKSLVVGKKLKETNIRSELDIVVVSIQRSRGEMVFNPSGDTLIAAGDILIAIGKAESLMKLTEMLK